MGELMGFLLVMWLVILGVEQTAEYKAGDSALELIKQCEERLPRNVKCIIIATPEDIKENNNE